MNDDDFFSIPGAWASQPWLDAERACDFAHSFTATVGRVMGAAVVVVALSLSHTASWSPNSEAGAHAQESVDLAFISYRFTEEQLVHLDELLDSTRPAPALAELI